MPERSPVDVALLEMLAAVRRLHEQNAQLVDLVAALAFENERLRAQYLRVLRVAEDSRRAAWRQAEAAQADLDLLRERAA